MKKLYRLPGWIILRLVWPLFSNNHSWKAPRKDFNYECYSLQEWYIYVRYRMNDYEKLMQNIVVDGAFWLITIWLGFIWYLNLVKS